MDDLTSTSKKGLVKNTFFNFLCQFCNLIAPLLTAPYLARVLNADLIGQNSYVASILSYFALVIVFGTNLYGTTVISKARDNPKEKTLLFLELNFIKGIMFGCSCVVYIFLIFFYKEYQILFLIYSISLVTNLIDITWFYQGVERFGLISVRTLITKIITILCVFVFVKTENDFYLYVTLSLLGTLIPNVLLIPTIKKDIVRISLKEMNFNRHWRKLVPFFLVNSLISVYSVLDKTMLKIITGSNLEVGYYEQAHKLYNLCSTLTVVIGPVLNARIAFVYNNKKKREALFDVGFRYLYMLALPIAVGTFMLSNQIIDVFFGEGYDPSKTVLAVFSILPLITGMGMMTGHLYYTPTMRTKISIIACGVGAVVNFGLNILLSYYFGAVGAAIATVIAEAIITIIEMILFKDGNKKHLLLMSWKYILSSILMGVLLFILMKFLILDNQIIQLVIYILVCAAFYFLCLLFMKEPLLVMGIQAMRNKFKKWKVGKNGK